MIKGVKNTTYYVNKRFKVQAVVLKVVELEMNLPVLFLLVPCLLLELNNCVLNKNRNLLLFCTPLCSSLIVAYSFSNVNLESLISKSLAAVVSSLSTGGLLQKFGIS